MNDGFEAIRVWREFPSNVSKPKNLVQEILHIPLWGTVLGLTRWLLEDASGHTGVRAFQKALVEP